MFYFRHSLYTLCCLSAIAFAMSSALPAKQNVDPADPEVQACVAFGMESFNFHSPTQKLNTISKFHSVTREEVGGGRYDIDVELIGSSHSSNNQVFRCHFVIVTAPWKNHQRILIKSSCEPVS
ncbi:cystatin-1 [Esox lucius]|uniref:cystatin-1 n=1 Tax=Esox lucius TaxID=8010 RepID=UPI0005769A04|nr:cystatin-1 [Esox lucius]